MSNLTDQLRTLAPGDVVFFRCGGCQKIENFHWSESSSFGEILSIIWKEGVCASVYNKNGFCNDMGIETPFDIIRVEKAFRWEDVKPGMGFYHIEDDMVVNYVGPYLTNNSVVWIEHNTNARWYYKSELTRHPEADREVL